MLCFVSALAAPPLPPSPACAPGPPGGALQGPGRWGSGPPACLLGARCWVGRKQARGPQGAALCDKPRAEPARGQGEAEAVWLYP